jgi:hypothetical protein
MSPGIMEQKVLTILLSCCIILCWKDGWILKKEIKGIDIEEIGRKVKEGSYEITKHVEIERRLDLAN